MSDKKYNHALSISWSFDSDLPAHELNMKLGTRAGISEACARLIKRIQQVIEDEEIDAIEIWDSYEH